MEILKFGENYKLNNCVLVLGYFDSIHKGHRYLINLAKESKENSEKLAVFMLTGGKNSEKDVFSFKERLILLSTLGVDVVIYAELNETFKNTTKEEFLTKLKETVNVSKIFVGEDFRYGKNAQGTPNEISKIFTKSQINILKKIKDESGDYSTKRIKTALLSGDILTANTLLNGNYFIFGKVVKGKMLGRTYGFPTANITLESEKMQIKSGVYATFTIIDGKLFSCITNVGAQPTFEGQNTVIETYISGYNGDLYGKYLTVYFIEKIRDIVKFNGVNELKAQLEKDLEYVK